MLRYPNTLNIYYSQEQLKHFGLDILVVYEILEHFELIKSLCAELFVQTRRKSELCQNDLNYIKSLCIKMTRYEMFQYSQIAYINSICH